MFLSTLSAAAGSWDQTCAPLPVLEKATGLGIVQIMEGGGAYDVIPPKRGNRFVHV